MNDFSGLTIVLGVGGGIAAYKACDLARLFVKGGAQVRVAMTPAATRFVGPLTFQALTGAPVLVDLLDPEADRAYGHLTLARAADLLVIAPATADLLARLRAGMADDAVTTTALACEAPVLLAPAMNTRMWRNPAVRENVAALARRGWHLVGPSAGLLADGDVGEGRLAEPAEIATAAARLLVGRDLVGRRVLVTAGPTREPLDPVRFISNPSTGRMGFAVARAAARRGAEVVLVSGPV
ncbi:MAG TPA: bifunctional phosphopantothenoylcysteine decarboxylase/phosphopantothenate--cysteine ligase CoaBC, partial [Anaeromyxobacteraceae bacterium]